VRSAALRRGGGRWREIGAASADSDERGGRAGVKKPPTRLVGSPAPDFSIDSVNGKGKKVSVKDLQG